METMALQSRVLDSLWVMLQANWPIHICNDKADGAPISFLMHFPAGANKIRIYIIEIGDVCMFAVAAFE
jgi:hypothetical protein